VLLAVLREDQNPLRGFKRFPLAKLVLPGDVQQPRLPADVARSAFSLPVPSRACCSARKSARRGPPSGTILPVAAIADPHQVCRRRLGQKPVGRPGRGADTKCSAMHKARFFLWTHQQGEECDWMSSSAPGWRHPERTPVRPECWSGPTGDQRGPLLGQLLRHLEVLHRRCFSRRRGDQEAA